MKRTNYDFWGDTVVPNWNQKAVPWMKEQFDFTKPWPTYDQMMNHGKPQVTNDQIGQMAVDMASPFAKMGGLIGHTVWHGSPHKFARPSIDHIGKGEGNQMFGHGFYTAESPATAEGYRQRLSMRMSGETPEQIQAQMQNVRETLQGPERARQLAGLNAQLQMAQESTRVPEGMLYKMDIPDEDLPHYLDWDQPIWDQEEILKHLEGTEYWDSAEGRIDQLAASVGQNPTGHHLHHDMLEEADPAEVAQKLQEMGILGIKYKGDQYGLGTDGVDPGFNFVTFDPDRIKVEQAILGGLLK